MALLLHIHIKYFYHGAVPLAVGFWRLESEIPKISLNKQIHTFSKASSIYIHIHVMIVFLFRWSSQFSFCSELASLILFMDSRIEFQRALNLLANHLSLASTRSKRQNHQPA